MFVTLTKHSTLSTLLLDSEFNPYYTGYIEKYRDKDILQSLKSQKTSFLSFLTSFPEDKLPYAYDEGKWTSLQVFGHLMDTERIMAYRALAISRKDTTSLPGFDQDEYVENIDVSQRTLDSYVTEFKAVRDSTIALYENFSSDQLQFLGKASNSPVSVRALGYIILGHLSHHEGILVERYLAPTS